MLGAARPRSLPSVLLLAAALLACATPALAGRLSELPWENKIPASVRSGVGAVMDKEKAALEDQKNEKGKPFVRFSWSVAAIKSEAEVDARVTIQRFLADTMTVERWRYTVVKKGNAYEITARDKTLTNDDAKRRRVEPAQQARALPPFRFKHDLLELNVESGSYVVESLGNLPSALHATARGRIRLTPVSDYEAMFFERRLGARELNDTFSELVVEFYPGATWFFEATGLGKADVSAPGSGTSSSALQDLVKDATRDYADDEYSQYAYGLQPRPENAKRLVVRVKTDKKGWIQYSFDPTSPKEIWVVRLLEGMSLRQTTNQRFEMVSYYAGPETRALPLNVQERRRDFRLVDPIRYDAQFDIDSDKLNAVIDMEIRVLADTPELDFYLAGNPVVRHVRLDDGRDLLVVPYSNLLSDILYFEERQNYYRVILPEPVKAGQELRLQVSYRSPKAVTPMTATYWEIARFGLLPFMGGLAEKSYMRFVLRTPKAYDHVAIGSKLAEEVDDDYRYSEWGAEPGLNFPVIGIGRYHKPTPLDVDGVTYVGYMNKMMLTSRDQVQAAAERAGANASQFLAQFPEPNPAAMDSEVAQAAVAARTYGRWFGEKYPFKTLKLISSPLMGMSAQAPTSVVFIGEYIFWPTTAVAQLLGYDPTWITAVTAHETAHQWFGGIVTNINSDHYWFVETFAELSAMYYRESINDKTGLKGTLQYWRNSTLNYDWVSALIDDVYPRDPNVGTLLRYTKGPYVFWMLREYYDETKVLRFLRNLIQAHAGDLISTSDVQRVAEQTFGEDMTWFFDQYVRNNGIPEVRYKFDAPRPAEDGQGWIVTGQLEQALTIRGEKQAGRYFKKLLVPLTVETESGTHKEKVFMDAPQQQVRFRVPAKPRGSVKVNDGDSCLLVVKAM